MALLELGGKRFPIPVGDIVLGSDSGCAIVLGGAGVLPKHVLLKSQPDGQVAIRKAVPSAMVVVNGVQLGAEPTPLLHGDKVLVGGSELTFVDERRSGSTQYIAAVSLRDMAQEGKAARSTGGPGASPTGNTGGRIVSLTDGREYVIAGASLVFGREAGCDVVVAGKDVSRRHAEIVQTPKGYLLVDSSTNGTFVNDERVQGQRLLGRADVVRIGDESFRFYADTAPPSSPAPGPSAGPGAPRAAPPPAAPSPPAAPAPRSSERLRPTTHEPAVRLPTPPPPPAPSPAPAPRPSQAGPLANLLVTGGALKGQRFALRAPVINIGRAEYNDVQLADASVSTTHAKLQRREGVWVLVDLDSTNGSYIDGERVQGEAPVAPGASVKLGDVPLVFESTDDALGVEKGGGTVVLSSYAPLPSLAQASAAPAPAPATPPPAPKAAPPPAPPERTKGPGKRPAATAPAAPKKKGAGCGAGVIVLVAGGALAVALLRWILA